MSKFYRWAIGVSRAAICLFAVQVLGFAQQPARQLELAPAKSADSIRIATFNVSMNRSGPNRLSEDLQRGDPQIKAIAAVIRSVRPDIVVLNELDYSATANNVLQFEQKFLSEAVNDVLGNGPHSMPFHYSAPVNTGEPSGMDLNQNGRTADPEDAWGFGRFPGQYGMAVLSRFEIDAKASRTFQQILWSDLNNASRPTIPDTGKSYYDETTWKKLRLPSKCLWDVVINVSGQPLHMLVSHPTPPAFDGPEDRNGCRNQDEIRLLVDYITTVDISAARSNSEKFWTDDQGREGKLPASAKFFIAGDLNSDPVDGDNRHDAIRQLLEHPRVQSELTPQSVGSVQAAELQAQKNTQHLGNPAFDTGDFNDQVVGNLRIDYVLPSVGLKVKATGVVWPKLEDDTPAFELLKTINAASDHHLVWIDVGI